MSPQMLYAHKCSTGENMSAFLAIKKYTRWMFISGSVPSWQNVYQVSGNIKKKNTENTIFLRIFHVTMYEYMQ